MGLDVSHGRFIDILGAPAKFGNCTFVPAIVELDGTRFSPQFDFSDWCSDAGVTPPPIANRDTNAPWVLGRLMHLFQSANTPEDERSEKTCFQASFLVVLEDHGGIAVPFEASDAYGRTALLFSSENEAPLSVRRAIANAFYGLLLEEADALTDYQNRLFHSGASVWIDFGVADGEPFMQERPF